MKIKFICKECSHEAKEQTKFCSHCGKPLEMVETTYKIMFEVKFTEKPICCSECRFGENVGYKIVNGISEFKGECLLNPDIQFDDFNKNKYFGFWSEKIEECPILNN